MTTQNNNKSNQQNNEGKDPTRVEAGKKAAETRKEHGTDHNQKGSSSTSNHKNDNK